MRPHAQDRHALPRHGFARRPGAALLLSLFLLPALARPLDAQWSPPLRSSDLIYGAVFFGSLAAVVPAESFEEGLSRRFPVRTGGVAGAFSDAGEVAGHLAVDYGLAGAAYLGGRLTGHRGLAALALHAGEAMLVADAIDGGFKVALGRRRPIAPLESDRFSPVAFDEAHQSFPSGHASRTFALAGTLALELGPRRPWIPYVAYPVAGLVGTSRVVGRDHWLTDVVAGAALGLFASRVTARLNGVERGDTTGRMSGEGRTAGRGARLSLGPAPGGGVDLDVTLPAPR